MEIDKRYEVIYEHARQTLANQEMRLDSIRSRAGLLVGLGSVALTFIGRDNTRISLALLVAIAAFCLVVGAALVILWPSGGWWFRWKATDLLDGYTERPDGFTHEQMLRSLSRFAEKDFKTNEGKMTRLYYAQMVGILLLAIEVVALIVSAL